MGKGDMKTKRGKIVRGSYGKSRPRKKTGLKTTVAAVKKEEKTEAPKKKAVKAKTKKTETKKAETKKPRAKKAPEKKEESKEE